LAIADNVHLRWLVLSEEAAISVFRTATDLAGLFVMERSDAL